MIILFTQLLALFQLCRAWKSEDTLVNVYAHGTMAEVVTTCVNPNCGKEMKWCSQPHFPGTKIIAAGNLLLSFGIVAAGTSATKVLRTLQHMGMTCFSLKTFFKHQQVSLLDSNLTPVPTPNFHSNPNPGLC